MSMKFTSLQCKAVICIASGQRLGFVSDIEVSMPEGNVCAVIVPCPGKFMGLTGHSADYRIPWSCIKKIGPDIILVDTKPDECRVNRGKKGLLF